MKEGINFGAAIGAGVGAGIYNSISEDTKTLVKWDKIYEPNMKFDGSSISS